VFLNHTFQERLIAIERFLKRAVFYNILHVITQISWVTSNLQCLNGLNPSKTELPYLQAFENDLIKKIPDPSISLNLDQGRPAGALCDA